MSSGRYPRPFDLGPAWPHPAGPVRSALGKCEGPRQMVDALHPGANSARMRRCHDALVAGRIRRTRRLRARVPSAFGVAVLALTLSACGSSVPPAPQAERVTGGPTGHYVVAKGIHKIKHVIIIEQENRSFDS